MSAHGSVPSPAGHPHPGPAGHPHPGVGTVIGGRYRIEEPIGRGGFGVVFRATELRLARPVALKLLLPEVVHRPGALERFHREFALARILEHPNTVRLLDYGTSDDGNPFIAWELLRGVSLEHELAGRGPLSPRRVAHIGCQVLRSLMEAHAKGIVHRDIKPANVFLCDFPGAPDFAKVLDFGVARVWAGDEHQALTIEGATVGTPSYMAPEQVLGDGIDARADLYSLGLVLAEMLTGRVVMWADTPMKTCIAQASSEPVPLSEAVRRSSLGDVIGVATQKTRSERYASAEAMLLALEAAAGESHDVPVVLTGAVANAPTMLQPIALPDTALAPTLQHVPPHVVGHTGVPLSARAAGASHGWIAALVALALVVGGGGGAALLYYAGGSSSTPAAEEHEPELQVALPNGPPMETVTAPKDLADVKLKGVTFQRILDRFAERGWQLSLIRDDDAGSVRVVAYVMQGSTHLGGTVQLHRFVNELDGKMSAPFYRTTGTTLREGRMLLFVSVSASPSLSKTVLDQMLQ